MRIQQENIGRAITKYTLTTTDCHLLGAFIAEITKVLEGGAVASPPDTPMERSDP